MSGECSDLLINSWMLLMIWSLTAGKSICSHCAVCEAVTPATDITMIHDAQRLRLRCAARRWRSVAPWREWFAGALKALPITECQQFEAFLRYQYRVFPLGGQGAILGDHGPAITQYAGVSFALVDHRLDGKRHAGT